MSDYSYEIKILPRQEVLTNQEIEHEFSCIFAHFCYFSLIDTPSSNVFVHL
jgi:hypothetical protein